MLKVKQGRNQKGLCFVSDKAPFKDGPYLLLHSDASVIADIRTSSNVPPNLIVLDQRIFAMLSCSEESEIDIERINEDIPECSELHLSLDSTRNLDNRKIADAISKRVNDLNDDFDGLILKVGQSLAIDRLGIRFTTKSISPESETHSAARIIWKKLEKIHLVPLESLGPFNIVCVVEIGAASQVSDVKSNDHEKISRYEMFMKTIDIISKAFPDYHSGAQFSGFAYSDDIFPFTVFDQETGNPTEITSLHSASVFVAFRDWLQSLIEENMNKVSNPGLALSKGIERVDELYKIKPIQTVLLLISSGVHTSGPNPVKVCNNFPGNTHGVFLCVIPGETANYEVMNAIADKCKGAALQIRTVDDVNKISNILSELLGGT